MSKALKDLPGDLPIAKREMLPVCKFGAPKRHGEVPVSVKRSLTSNDDLFSAYSGGVAERGRAP